MSPSYPSYPTNLTDEQWELLGHLIPAAKAGGRSGTVELQAVVHPSSTSCVLVARGGCYPTTFPAGKRSIIIFGVGA